MPNVYANNDVIVGGTRKRERKKREEGKKKLKFDKAMKCVIVRQIQYDPSDVAVAKSNANQEITQ